MAHHRFSASGAEGWMTCAGKLSMEDGLPDSSSAYADEGSAAHFLASECLTLGKAPKTFRGKDIVCWSLPDSHDGQTFSDGALPEGAVERSRWLVTQEMSDYIDDYIAVVKKATGKGELLVEQKVDFGWAIGIEGAFGTSDTVIISEDGSRLTIIDLKYGYNPVSAEDNPQMQLYALGALRDFDMFIDTEKLKEVELIIFQPRIGNDSRWVCPIEDLVAFADKAKEAAQVVGEAYTYRELMDAVDWETMYLQASDKGCKYCKAKGNCAELKRNVYADMPSTIPSADDFDTIVNDNLEPEVVLDRALEALPGIPFKDLVKLYSVIDKHKLFIEAVEARMWQDMMAGQKHADYKLVLGRGGNRVWKDPKEVEAVMKVAKFREAEMYDRKIISPAAAEKLLKERPRMWKKIETMITRTEGKPVIASRADKRPPIDPYNDNLDQFPLLEDFQEALMEELKEFDII